MEIYCIFVINSLRPCIWLILMVEVEEDGTCEQCPLSDPRRTPMSQSTFSDFLSTNSRASCDRRNFQDTKTERTNRQTAPELAFSFTNQNLWFLFAGWLKQQDCYVCLACGNVYMHYSSLKRHMKEQCGQAPKYQCPYCPRRTSLRFNLSRHMRKKHKEGLRMSYFGQEETLQHQCWTAKHEWHRVRKYWWTLKSDFLLPKSKLKFVGWLNMIVLGYWKMVTVVCLLKKKMILNDYIWLTVLLLFSKLYDLISGIVGKI